ncbi:MAG: energy transducer TonB [Chthoniobacterales bacterium]
MLLSSVPGKKAGALAASLTAQSLALGTLLLIPLIYTDRLPFAQLQLPTFLPSPPRQEIPKPEPALRRRAISRVRNPFVSPTTIPPLNREPDLIDNAPGLPDRIDSGPPIPTMPNMIIAPIIPPPPLPTHLAEPTSMKPIAVTSDIQSAKLIHKVIPVYPNLARNSRISGMVRLQATVSAEGTVEKLEVLSGNPMLVPAAVDAVRQWVYRPTILHNIPVEVIAPIDVIFTLSQ